MANGIRPPSMAVRQLTSTTIGLLGILMASPPWRSTTTPAPDKQVKKSRRPIPLPPLSVSLKKERKKEGRKEKDLKKMSKSPVFPVPEPHLYSDYGFDPHVDYFQVLEEARRRGKRSEARSLDALHFKLQKPISKDEAKAKARKRRRWWWKSTLLFWRRAKACCDAHDVASASRPKARSPCSSYPHRAASGPLYATESAGSSTLCRTSGPSSGQLAAAAEFGAAGIPYLSLQDLNLVDGHRISASATPAPMPIYLVT